MRFNPGYRQLECQKEGSWGTQCDHGREIIPVGVACLQLNFRNSMSTSSQKRSTKITMCLFLSLLQFFFRAFSIIRMNVLPECISKLWVPWKLEEDAESSGTGVTDGFGPPFGSQ